MDEAEYCDRVSIMVDGRIRALGTPEELKKKFGRPDMDGVFKRWRAARRGGKDSMEKFFAFVGKEFRQISRDKRSAAILFALPIVLLVLFGFAITNDIKESKFAVLDNAQSPLSKAIVGRLDASEYFSFYRQARSRAELEEFLMRGIVKTVVVFGADFEKKVAGGGPAQINIVLDACDPNESENLSNYARAVISAECAERLGIRPDSPQIDVRVNMLFNPQLKSAYDFVPGVMGLILFLICTLMTSVGIVREKEMGNMEILLVSPMRPIYIIIAKVVPYFALSILIVAVCIFLANALFGVPIRGSIALIFGISVLYTLLALNIGITVSTLANTQQTAMFISTSVFMLPTVLLSGMVFPIENMPRILQYLSEIVPAKWYIAAIRDVMLKGGGVGLIAENIAVMSAMAFAFALVSLARFKTRLE